MTFIRAETKVKHMFCKGLMRAGDEGRMASFQTDHSKAMFTDDNEMELVLTTEYSSVDSTICHTEFFMPALPPHSNVWVCP